MAEDTTNKAKDFQSQFKAWWDGGPGPVVDDNRRRYRMLLKDKAEREERGLSAIPSTKSCSVVDNFAIDAVMEYFAEPDNITYTAKDTTDIQKDLMARWLTEIFRYRSEYTFPFQPWLMQNMKIAGVDGMIGAIVSWKKESYKEKQPAVYAYINEQGQKEPITKDIYDAYKLMSPDKFIKEVPETEVVLRDTWWIDTLKPGESLFWDFKSTSMNLSDGSCCLAIIHLTPDEIQGYVDKGVFDKISEEDIKRFQDVNSTERADTTSVATDPKTVNLDHFNRVPVWIWFEKKGCQWFSTFILGGIVEVKKETNVNEVFFGGRRVNRLPVVLGCIDFELWEWIGRGLPKLIAPLEDELVNHKNNINDAAKLTIEGRWRINPGSDVDIDMLLNAKTFEAAPGEVERMQDNFGILESMRAADIIAQDMAEVVPVGMSSKNLVPKGTAKTLGAVQLALGDEKKTLNSRLMCFNVTFMKPLLYLIAQNEFSFETDELILRIAGANVKTDNSGQPANFNVPMSGGKIDLSSLDLEVEIQINAGLGAIPRQQKFQKMIQVYQLGKELGINQDNEKIYEQACVLASFNPGQFKSKAPSPQPPEPEISGTVNIDIAALRPDLQEQVIMRLLTGKIKANIREQPTKPMEADGMRLPVMEDSPNDEEMIKAMGMKGADGQVWQ